MDPVSVLTGPEIVARMAAGSITISPTPAAAQIGSNSVDVHLGETLQTYNLTYAGPARIAVYGLDVRRLPPLEDAPRTGGAWLLVPGRVYLGVTIERVAAHGVTWMLGLRSSAGRLGLASLAGIGDDGFEGRITVELTVAQPLYLRPGMRLFQITFYDLIGERRPYAGRYQGATGVMPSLLGDDEGGAP